MRLDGVMLKGAQLKQLKTLVARSFIQIPEATRSRTPPPSPPSQEPSAESADIDHSSAWKITPGDLRDPSPALVDKGKFLTSSRIAYLIYFQVPSSGFSMIGSAIFRVTVSASTLALHMEREIILSG